MITPVPKPARGTHVLDRELQRYQLLQLERIAKSVAKKRDAWGCRWPELHKCRGPIEVAHVFEDKKMGGDHGRLSHSSALMTLCAARHRLATPSIHGKLLKVEPETELGADGPCSFWHRPTLLDDWICVGVEIRIGVLRKV